MQIVLDRFGLDQIGLTYGLDTNRQDQDEKNKARIDWIRYNMDYICKYQLGLILPPCRKAEQDQSTELKFLSVYGFRTHIGLRHIPNKQILMPQSRAVEQ